MAATQPCGSGLGCRPLDFRHRLLAATALLLAPAVAVHAGASSVIPCAYESVIVESPPIAGFETNLVLTDMNDAGVAVGMVTLLDPFPCIWTEAGGVKYIPAPAGVSSANPVAINNNGWVLVNASKAGAGARGYVLVPAGENWVWIEMVPSTGAGYSQLYGINEKNVVVGRQLLKEGETWLPYWRGFRWSLGQPMPVELVEAPGWDTTELADINDEGVICGTVCQGYSPAAGASPSARAIVLAEGTFTTIEPPEGFGWTYSRAINNAGLVACTARANGEGDLDPMSGVVHDIATRTSTVIPPPEGTVRWWAVDINESGLIAGNSLEHWTTIGGKPCVSDGQVCLSILDLLPPPPPTSGIDWAYKVTSTGIVVGDCVAACARLYVPTWASSGDIDCDGVVGAADLAALIGTWGLAAGSGSTGYKSDLNNDGSVEGADLGLLLQGWTE